MRFMTFIVVALAFASPATSNESTEAPSRIIVIAADHSESMRDNGNHSLQINSIRAALISYNPGCSSVKMSYLPWGALPAEPTSFVLNDDAKRNGFINKLDNLRNFVVRGTIPGPALKKAIKLVQEANATSSVIVLITDESHRGEYEEELPEGSTLIKIALNKEAHLYLENKFVSGSGFTYYVDSSQEEAETNLTARVSEALSVLNEICVS